MAKAEWGQKRQCPKCGARFYDLGNEPPLTCVSCGVVYTPEPILKPRSPVAAPEAPPKPVKEVKAKRAVEKNEDIDEDGEDILLNDEDDEDIDIDEEDDVISYEEADDEVAGTIKIKTGKDED